MKKLFVLLVFVLVFSGVSYSQQCDACSSLATDQIKLRLGDRDNVVNFWLYNHEGDDGHFFYGLLASEYIQARQKKIDRLKKWAITITDIKYRKAYLAGLDSYQDGFDEAKKEYSTHENLNQMNTYMLKEIECKKAGEKYASTHKIPIPPE